MFFRLLREGFIFAVNSIVVNKLRTFLSLFGITIGIFAIISVFTVLDWMEKSIKDNISSLGDRVVYVQKFPWSFDPGLAWWDIIQWPAPSLDDYEAIQRNSSNIEAACFSAITSRQVKFRKNIAGNAGVWAATHEFEVVRNFEIESGRYFSPYESISGKPVAIVGAEIANELFGLVDPIGKEIVISGYKAQVIGVFKKEGQGGLSDSGMDELILIPLHFGKTFMNLRNRFIDSMVITLGKEGVSSQELSDEITMILRASRRIRPEEESTFSVNRASLLTQGFDAVFAGINVGGWLIGGFSILVGGFGIANIMFVSVRERTSIIGIQKALGAKKYFILQQFLYESVILSLLGGLLGLLMVFAGTTAINYFYDLGMYLTVGNIVLALTISGTIGVVAGYAPARTAARMNPVDAIGFSF